MEKQDSPKVKRFYNCDVYLYTHQGQLLGKLAYDTFKPDHRFVKDYEVLSDGEDLRVTQTGMKDPDNGFFYMIFENKDIFS